MLRKQTISFEEYDQGHRDVLYKEEAATGQHFRYAASSKIMYSKREVEYLCGYGIDSCVSEF
jgi:hypothetical protein